MTRSTYKSSSTLMVQGTTSDAGKSILVTAFCRILARHKISVAPFKPQNMALNSAVTRDGGEIGRAQAVQAEAAFLSPTVAMNPVLLKPNSDLGAQVVVNGRAIGNMEAKQYHAFKPELLKIVVAAHQNLIKEYQTVIVEGAGSPAEINLREHDIANMGFAETIDCAVVILADIDRGGVLAHLYGTFALLSETEKSRVEGFIINRFRGDVDLLQPGLEWLEEKTGVPVIAVIPYLDNLHIEAEDSISQSQASPNLGEVLKVSIISYPRMSNHTDFDVLRMHPQIHCEFVKEASEFDGADLIILPGSKNVRGDLRWLFNNGWQPILDRHLRYGGKLIGVCGGFQMLGQVIHDPDAIEDVAGSSEALAYFEMETILIGNKILRNVTGQHTVSGNAVKGYEIHSGISRGDALQHPMFDLLCDDEPERERFMDGAISDDNNILGSYVHGLFDNAAMLKYLLTWIGLTDAETFHYDDYREKQIERLADAVEKAMPLPSILKLLGFEEQVLS